MPTICLQKTSFLLFLNKFDIFEQKINKVSFFFTFWVGRLLKNWMDYIICLCTPHCLGADEFSQWVVVTATYFCYFVMKKCDDGLTL
jgi:hypothetical protein